MAVNRVAHGYGETCGVPKMGAAGMGMVVGFGTPQYTITRTRVTGIHGLSIY